MQNFLKFGQNLLFCPVALIFCFISKIQDYLSVGPPVYFVVNNTNLQLDFANTTAQNRICGGQGCDPDSLQSQIKLWSKEPNVTFIGSPAQSWIDDYFGWGKDCCQFNPADPPEFCPSDYIPTSVSIKYLTLEYYYLYF